MHKMYLNAYLNAYICTHMHIFTHNHAYLHALMHEDTTIFKSVLIICIQEHSMDTRVLYLQLVRLQGNTKQIIINNKQDFLWMNLRTYIN